MQEDQGSGFVAGWYEALRAVSREIMRNHLKHCASDAIRSTDTGRSEAMYDELIDLMYKHVR